jgi:imidazolonepropionase-like amidohydrolase
MGSSSTNSDARTAPRTVFRNAALLDPARGEIEPDRSLVSDAGRIVDIGGPGLSAGDARSIDVRGMTLMPGLVDAHVHVTAVTANLATMAEWSPYYVAARAAEVLSGMLSRGFTTVRDVGGADYGIAEALDEGYLVGPRVLFGGKALSQTGGHADTRSRGRMAMDPCELTPTLGVVCDGPDQVRLAARHQLRRGASHLKLMLGGGVASPTDRVDSTQFSLEEIRAAVEEAEAANRYVAGHAYAARAINRGLQCGVRSIEHGNLMDASCVDLFLEHAAFYVPTLVTYSALAEKGLDYGLPVDSHRKVFDVLDAGLHALELAHRAGVSIAFGTDLLGPMHAWQSREFAIRAEVQPAADILRSATSVGAKLVNLDGQIGTLAPDAFADLIVVDGNPLEDIRCLSEPERSIKLVMKAGVAFRDELA